MKKFFKKGLASTMVASVVSGAGSVAADYVIGQIDALSTANADYINGGKVVAGAILGSMTRNQYLKSMADGIAAVGAANLVQSLVDGTMGSGTSGLPKGTIGSAKAGDRYFRKNGKKRNNGFTVSSAFISD